MAYNEDTNHNGKILDEFLINNNCSIINANKNYTYHRYNSVTKELVTSVLDYGITGEEITNKCSNYKTINFDILESDHIPIYFEVALSTTTIPPSSSKRVYSKSKWPEFRKHLDQLNITDLELNTKEDIDNNLKDINNNINQALDYAVPMSKPNKKNKLSLPEELLKIIKIKNNMMRNFYSNRTDLITRTIYYQMNSYIKDEIIRIKNNEWQKLIDSYRGKPLTTKDFWKHINKIKGKGSNNSIGTLKENDTIAKDTILKINIFKNRL